MVNTKNYNHIPDIRKMVSTSIKRTKGMKVEVELRDYVLLVEALFQYEEYLARELSLHHTAEEREAIDNKFAEVSKLVPRIAAQAEQTLDRVQGKS